MEIIKRVYPNIGEVEEGLFEFVVGRMLRGAVRDMLESEQFAGRPIRWREGRGWVERVFDVVGPPEHIRQVEERLMSWANAVNTSAPFGSISKADGT